MLEITDREKRLALALQRVYYRIANRDFREEHDAACPNLGLLRNLETEAETALSETGLLHELVGRVGLPRI